MGFVNVDVICSFNEYVKIIFLSNQFCSEYFGDFIFQVGGYLFDENVESDCEYCFVLMINIFLIQINFNYDNRW